MKQSSGAVSEIMALEIKNLNKSYRDFKLDNLNLSLPSGCIMGLVGENGAGKSTTIKLILDMIRPDSGTITVMGKSNKEDRRISRDDVGVVLDEVGISGCLTAVQVGKIMSSMYRRWDGDAYKKYLKTFSVPENKKFDELSKGNKMKLGIAIA